jgi:hypothetical protein
MCGQRKKEKEKQKERDIKAVHEYVENIQTVEDFFRPL